MAIKRQPRKSDEITNLDSPKGPPLENSSRVDVNKFEVDQASRVAPTVAPADTKSTDSSDIELGQFIFSKSRGLLVKGKGKNASPMKFAEYARITEVTRNLVTNEEDYVLEYYRSSTQQIDTINIKGDLLMGANVENLVCFGVDIHPANKKSVLAALTLSRKQAKTAIVYDVYGWRNLTEGPAFLHSHAITRRGALTNYNQADSARLSIKPSGSYSDWLSMYKKHVKGNTPLELAVVLGASAAVLAHLDSRFPDLKTLLVHFNGQSSQGKTTAAMLALSVGGNPTSSGLLKSWNSTQNAIMSHLDGINGIATCFDELSQTSSKNLTSLLYSLAEGKQKDRSTRSGGLRETSHWCTTILSTGELSMFNKLDKNIGLRVRILEFSQVQWTDSGRQSEEIKQVVANNYGHLLPDFVEKILYAELVTVISEFEVQRDILLKRMPESPTTERISMKLAVIMTTASLLSRMEIIPLDVEAIREFLLEHDRRNLEDRDMATVAIDSVCQYLVANQSKLIRAEANRIPNEVMGKIFEKTIGGTKTMYASILKLQFEEMMTALGYQDSKVILNEWQQKGLLLAEKGRLEYRPSMLIDGQKHTKVPTYAFAIPPEYQPMFVEPANYTLDLGTSDAARRNLGIDLEPLTEEDFNF